MGDDVRAADLDNNFTFDLPSYDDALGMEKIEQPGFVNKAFDESPPEYEPPSYAEPAITVQPESTEQSV